MANGGPANPGGSTPLVWRTFLGVLLIGLAVVLRILMPFLAVVLVSLVTVGLISPSYERLVRLLRGHRRTAATLVCLVLVLAVMVPLFVTVQAVSREALGFYEMTTVQLPQRDLLEELEGRQDRLEMANRYLAPLGWQITPERIYDWLATLGVRLGAFFYRQGVSLATGLVRLALGFGFWIVILFYLMVDGRQLQQWFFDTLPLPPAQQQLLCRRFTDMARSLVIGNGLAGIIQGLAGGLLFAVLGLPGPVLWGVVMAILAFIPIIGISLVYVPVSAVLALTGHTGRAIALFVPLAVVATVVEYWLKPMLVGRRARVHTVLVFLSLLGGIDAFGAVGLLLGPLMMTAFLTLAGIYRETYHPSRGQPRPGGEAQPAGPP